MDDDQKKCGGLTAGGLLILLFAGAMIVMGLLHVDMGAKDPVTAGECKVEHNIPVYLVVMGVLMLATMVVRCLLQRLCRKCGGNSDDKLCSTLNFGCNFTCILLYDILAFIVFVAWLSKLLKVILKNFDFLYNFGIGAKIMKF